MLDTFKARLRAKYPKANLSQKRIDAFADRLHKKFPELTEEADHDEKIDDYYPEEDIMLIAKQDDTIRTLKAKPKDASDTTTQATTTTTTTQTDPPADEPPSWAKAMIEKLEKLEGEKMQSTISQTLRTHEKLKNIDPSFYEDYVQPKSLDEIDAFAEKVATKHAALIQNVADTSLSTTVKPVITTNTAGKDKVSPEMQAYLDAKKPVEVK